MNNILIPDFNSIAEIFGWTILHSLWQITVIALILKLLLLWTSKKAAALRYWMSLSALLLVVVWSSATFLTLWNDHSTNEIIAVSNSLANDTAATFDQATNAVSTTLYQQFSQQLAYLLAPFAPNLALLWLLGMVFFASRVVTGLFKLHQLSVNGIQPLPEKWQHQFEQLKQLSGIHRKVNLRLSTIVGVPITYRFFRPIILLPFSLFSGLSDEQIEVLLLHELAHIKRYDYLFNLIQSCIEVVFFYHPLVWWMSQKVRSEREHCCDDQVLQIRHQPMLYARTLTQIQVHHYSFKTKLAMSAKENTGAFSQRIYRLFPQKDAHSKLRNGIAAILLLFLSGGIMAFYPKAATPQPTIETKAAVQDSIPPKQTKSTVDPTEIEQEKKLYLAKEKEQLVLQEKLRALEKALYENAKAIEQDDRKDALKSKELEQHKTLLQKQLKALTKELDNSTQKGGASSSTTTKKDRLTIKKLTEEKPLVILDGTPYTNYTIDENGETDLNISSDDIQTINVYKGEKAIEKFGAAAKNGVIEINSKKGAATKENALIKVEQKKMDKKTAE
ncbi:MAG: M56 family metallopeptidase, partial [Bacteroidota bacterium]